MSRNAVGWTFVAAQVVLLAALVLVPQSDHWPTPTWVEVTALVLVAVGVLILAVAALRLGPALTATPVPVADGRLTTTGLYALVRHPIYTGVLLAVVGVAIRSGNVVTAIVAVATIGFFHAKAAWEERQLADHYADYADYADRTPRFIPSLRRLR